VLLWMKMDDHNTVWLMGGLIDWD